MKSVYLLQIVELSQIKSKAVTTVDTQIYSSFKSAYRDARKHMSKHAGNWVEKQANDLDSVWWNAGAEEYVRIKFLNINP